MYFKREIIQDQELLPRRRHMEITLQAHGEKNNNLILLLRQEDNQSKNLINLIFHLHTKDHQRTNLTFLKI
jgi:hypothetical protein